LAISGLTYGPLVILAILHRVTGAAGRSLSPMHLVSITKRFPFPVGSRVQKEKVRSHDAGKLYGGKEGAASERAEPRVHSNPISHAMQSS